MYLYLHDVYICRLEVVCRCDNCMHTCSAANAPVTGDEAAVEPMEVDKQKDREDANNQTTASDHANTSLDPVEDEGGFILEPVDITSAIDTSAKGKKRKRKLVVDTDKEFTSDNIRSQLENYSDILQQKLFPPPTKKAMQWKDMTTCEQLFMRPVCPFVAPQIIKIVTRNYTSRIPGELEESLLDLEQEEAPTEVNATRDTTVDIEKVRAEPGGAEGETNHLGDTTAPGMLLEDRSDATTLPLNNDRDYGMEDGMRPIDHEGDEFPPEGDVPNEQTNRVIPDMPDLEAVSSEDPSQATSAGEKQSEEMSEEFEKRRWTKRTQQVLRILGRSFSSKPETPFSTLTQKCNRKQAASRFYTCLLLAKENTIHVHQANAYGEILISKGPKFTKAF